MTSERDTVADWSKWFEFSITLSITERHPMTDAAFACWVESARKYAPYVVPRLKEIYERRQPNV